MENTEKPDPPAPKRKRGHPKNGTSPNAVFNNLIPKQKPLKIDLSKALELRFKHGHTYQQIADVFGSTKSAVYQRIHSFIPHIDTDSPIKEYETYRDSILSAAQMKFITRACEPSALKKASALQAISCYGILFDKQRLIRGESTDNVNIKSMALTLQADREKLIRALEQDNLGDSDTTNGQVDESIPDKSTTCDFT